MLIYNATISRQAVMCRCLETRSFCPQCGQGQEHITDVLESVKLIHVYSNRGYMLIYYDLVVRHIYELCQPAEQLYTRRNIQVCNLLS